MKNKESLQFTAKVTGKLALTPTKVESSVYRFHEEAVESKCDIALKGWCSRQTMMSGQTRGYGESRAWIQEANRDCSITFYMQDEDILPLIAKSRGDFNTFVDLLGVAFGLIFKPNAKEKWLNTIRQYVTFKFKNYL